MEKKRCIFLVEGPTDKQRFSVLQKLFKENELVIIPFNTDVLTQKAYSKKYKSLIKEALNKEKTYEYSDFDEIVQIIDTDGCFLSDKLIQTDHSISNIKYTNDSIICSNTKALRKQRENKRNNISTILEDGEIKLYYVSTNAEHAFDNKQNASNQEKRQLALKMYANYANNVGALLEKLQSIAPEVKTYEESWLFIKQDNNSLMPYSNIIFWVIDNIDYMKEEYRGFILQ